MIARFYLGLALAVQVLAAPALAQAPQPLGPVIGVFGLDSLRWFMPVSDVKRVFPDAVEGTSPSAHEDILLDPDLAYRGCRFQVRFEFHNGRLDLTNAQRPPLPETCHLDINAYLTQVLGDRRPNSSRVASDWDDGHLVVQYLHNDAVIDGG